MSGPEELPRVLGVSDLVLLVLGTVIGSGVFLVPGAILRPLGEWVVRAAAVWLTGGVLSLLGLWARRVWRDQTAWPRPRWPPS